MYLCIFSIHFLYIWPIKHRTKLAQQIWLNVNAMIKKDSLENLKKEEKKTYQIEARWFQNQSSSPESSSSSLASSFMHLILILYFNSVFLSWPGSVSGMNLWVRYILTKFKLVWNNYVKKLVIQNNIIGQNWW